MVIKPLNRWGGKGIIKIDNGAFYTKDGHITDEQCRSIVIDEIEIEGGVLLMEYVNDVHLGDKRVVVVNGKVMGCTLRKPAKGSWICNLSAGGSSHFAEADDDEKSMASRIGEDLIGYGVVIFGFDTLVGKNGRRVLSEINTFNVGGLWEAQVHSGRPVIRDASREVWSYIVEKTR